MRDMVYVAACKAKRWQLKLQSKSGKWDGDKRVPFKCRSWRHAGECREWCGQCDFKRCQQAMETFGDWTFLVLTYKRALWPNLRDLFRKTVEHFYAFRKRLRAHLYGPRPRKGEDTRPDFKYIQTWEITRKGTPHVNVAISCRELAEIVTSEGFWMTDARRKLGMRWQWYNLKTCFKTTVLEPMQVESGFGNVSTLEPLDDPVRLSRYMSKLATELTGSGSKNQTPVNAPRNFRRIRASRNTLPPRLHNEDVTGELEYTPHADASAEAWANYGKVLAIKAQARAWVDDALFR